MKAFLGAPPKVMCPSSRDISMASSIPHFCDEENVLSPVVKTNYTVIAPEHKRKTDFRLFPDELLYCEGMHRPAMRGMLHLLCSVLFPFGMWHLFLEANGRPDGQIAAEIYVFGNLFCCIMSSLFHVGSWPPRVEIWLQKLDHCGIAICSSCVNIPVCTLLLPRMVGLPLAVLSVGLCVWTCWNILLMNRPGVWRLILTAGIIAPFLPILAYYFTSFELLCALANCFFQGIGAAIFSRRAPNPWPSVFGFHEIFHVFTVCGFLSIYLCNWSIIRRTCNPYAHHLDVTEVLLEWFMDQPSIG